MPTIDVREVPAGPALDAACAEAMGWHLEQCSLGEVAQWLAYFDEDGHKIVDKRDWHPSEPWGITAAWELVEAMVEDVWGFVFAHSFPPSVIWEAAFERPEGWGRRHIGSAETAPLAICRAFLLAHGVEQLEVRDD